MSNISKVILKIENLTYFYESQFNKIEIFKNLNFEIKEGEIIGLLGPSGSGKTTLLNCIGLLDLPKSGKIKILNVDCSLQMILREQKLDQNKLVLFSKVIDFYPNFHPLKI